MQSDCEDASKFIRSVDSKVIKSFIQTIIENVIITDGRVTDIIFKNGIHHTFTYK